MSRWVPRIVVGAAALIFFPLLWCWQGNGGALTISSDIAPELGKQTAIILLAGSHEERVGTAAQLFLSGRSPLIILANDGIRGGWCKKHQRNLYFVERSEEALVQIGVPREAIVKLPFFRSGTVYDALMVRNYLLRHNIRHIDIVTSDYHASRASWIFRRVLPTNISFSICPSPSPTQGAYAQLQELIKFIFYVGYYGVFGLPSVPE